MKNKIWILSFMTVVAFGGPALASDGHNMKKENHEKHMAMKKGHHEGMEMNHDMAQDGKEVTLTGNLIGLSCFVKHGATGPNHKKCAQMCAEKGLPIGFKVEGQGIFMVSGEGHASLKETYKPLLKHLESKVMVKGKAFEKDGVKMIVIEKIKSA